MDSITLEDKIGKIVQSKLEKHNIEYDSIHVRVIYNVRTVGVQGDGRTYRHPVEVGVVKDGKTVWNVEFLKEISTEITNQIKEVNRVVYTL
ncbi:MAG TPA: hypothetical protein VJH92_00645 [Candidatus Nanoarchaeia archaeon]|nr:hypothetical protein [Candidatus Nanoarchaeia archaeon]